ncbi:Gfo/Idh/MocA family oxidoreductase [Thermosulfuriphilus ammonigenes]|uniref:Gfo/Idh/MocA family oxidoreductase n=1 Tax=Thermosulfuriphilus ammonigenes TaxID=1936021 RepID=A0A6G7PXF4_9BACT|nr:Gfo/Idh/MocA family oxidoreductase [Thermosulfuriphilus ammonigenes]MBA2849295.1 putative dehydrogenase [Thermosulfuriphilus ammonigenes]QIJ72375.1 Gfo/Idh/MocA family oxidoreductase [Thermosulfuriphilus ammonigenes]
MGDLKVAVIGVGYLGRFHAEKLARMPGVRLVAVVDIVPERAKEVGERLGVASLTDYRDLAGEVEAVSVVVPTREHFSVGRFFLEQGVHVFVEKPITATLEEADQLIELAGEKNLVLQVGHIERFNPAVAELLKQVDRPLFVEAHRLSGFKERSLDIDVVLDLMIHDLDIVLTMARAPLKTLHAVGVPVLSDKVDIASVRLVFEDGSTANLTASRISLRAMRRIRVFAAGRYLAVDSMTRNFLSVSRLVRPGGQSTFIPDERSFPETDPLYEELKTFVQAVKEGQEPPVSGREGREALGLALTILNEISRHLQEHPIPLNDPWIQDLKATSVLP